MIFFPNMFIYRKEYILIYLYAFILDIQGVRKFDRQIKRDGRRHAEVEKLS